MRKPTEIVDFLLDRVPELERRDLEARLKLLRAAGLFPTAKRVGDRPAEGVTARHCVNLLLAILGSNTATGAADSVPVLAELPLSKNMNMEGALLVVTRNKDHRRQDLAAFLEELISRAESRQRIVYLNVSHGPQWEANIVFQQGEATIDGVHGLLVTFEDPKHDWREGVHLSSQRNIDGQIFGDLAEFLGLIENAA